MCGARDDAANGPGAEARPPPPVPLWRLIGGVLLALYLPPIFALAVASRWRELSRGLRARAVLFSFLGPAAAVWHAATDADPTRMLPSLAMSWCLLLMWQSFYLCWARHRRRRASGLAKVLFGVSLAIATISTILWVFHLCWLIYRTATG